MAAAPKQPTVVGSASCFWLFSDHDGYDLTHPPNPSSPLVYPRLRLKTTVSDVTIAPSKTALFIIDMQNFFLATQMGRRPGPAHVAVDVLLKYGIPAARQAGIQIVWLTWGLTDEDLKTVPSAVWRIFGFIMEDTFEHKIENVGNDRKETPLAVAGSSKDKDTPRKREKECESGLGAPLGEITLEDGSVINAGRRLFRDQWNTALYGKLDYAFKEGLDATVPDVRFHKTRLSGLWEDSGPVQRFLEKQGIYTLLFTGTNTDQCVLGTIQEAFDKSFDTILLKDGCGTSSPEYASQMVEYNCETLLGFVSSCKDLAKGVEALERSTSKT